MVMTKYWVIWFEYTYHLHDNRTRFSKNDLHFSDNVIQLFIDGFIEPDKVGFWNKKLEQINLRLWLALVD